MKYMIEFELPDNDTVLSEIKTANVAWGIWGYSGYTKAKPVQRWIPCSERLPEESGRYLATRGLNACGALWNRVYIVNYSDLMGLKSERIWWTGNVGKSDFKRIDDVAAWMPLPKPWKGEADE